MAGQNDRLRSANKKALSREQERALAKTSNRQRMLLFFKLGQGYQPAQKSGPAMPSLSAFVTGRNSV